MPHFQEQISQVIKYSKNVVATCSLWLHPGHTHSCGLGFRRLCATVFLGLF